MSIRARSGSPTPALLPSYFRALRSTVGVRSLGRAAGLPDIRLSASGIAIDAGRLSRYAAVCGFGSMRGLAPSAVPSPYPHVLAFPLQLALLTRSDFPFPVLGLVHLANRIEQRRPITTADSLDVDVYVDGLAAHPRGSTFHLITDARISGQLVWRESSQLLARHRRHAADGGAAAASAPAVDVPAVAPAATLTWALRSDLGRRYAAVSGDRNPIHLFDATARPFGFRRHIVPGMWTLARAVAELGHHVPPEHTLDVAFRHAIELPGHVGFGRSTRPHVLEFGVSSPEAERTHLTGECRTGWRAVAWPSPAR